MRMIVKYLSRKETLTYECDKGSDCWKNNIKEAMEHLGLKSINGFLIHTDYILDNYGWTKIYSLSKLD